MRKVDILLCYRRPGAQTAKLFKRYLTEHDFPGYIWYSDSEPLGNYKTDIPALVDEAECAVLFIDPNFTVRFLDSDDVQECITALEIVEIAKKKIANPDFKLITVLLDREKGITPEESAVLQTLFERAGIENPRQAVLLFSQNNTVFFSTALGDEKYLTNHVSQNLFSNEFYRLRRKQGNFFFGKKTTYADVVLWDDKNGIHMDNILFSLTPQKIPLYDKISRFRSNLEYEVQNNDMVSLLEVSTVLSDNEEQKVVDFRYQTVEYKLFYKTIQLWQQLGLDQVMSSFDWRTDVYPIPNAMGLAFMVITSDNKLVFTKRSAARKIRPNEYDCSIVEGLKLEGTDRQNNPYCISDEVYLQNEVLRAFEEEICELSDLPRIKVAGIVLDKEYGQWNVVGTIRTDYTAEQISQLHALRGDTYEVIAMEFVPFAREDGTLSLTVLKNAFQSKLQGKMWSMALTVTYAALREVGFSTQDIYELSDVLY